MPMAAMGALGSRQMFARFEGLRVSSPLGGATPCVPALSAQRRCRHAQLQVSARQGEVSVGLFGTKAGMTQIFTDDGLALPATVIALEEGNVVAQIKTVDTDGYNAVQVGRNAVPAHMWRPCAHAPIRWPLADVRHMRWPQQTRQLRLACNRCSSGALCRLRQSLSKSAGCGLCRLVTV